MVFPSCTAAGIINKVDFSLFSSSFYTRFIIASAVMFRKLLFCDIWSSFSI